MSKDLMSMAKEVTKRIKNDPRTDLEKHWKVKQFMLGHNKISKIESLHVGPVVECSACSGHLMGSNPGEVGFFPLCTMYVTQTS